MEFILILIGLILVIKLMGVQNMFGVSLFLDLLLRFSILLVVIIGNRLQRDHHFTNRNMVVLHLKILQEKETMLLISMKTILLID